MSDREFDAAMRQIYEEAKREGYTASYFLRMLSTDGGVATAKKLIGSAAPSEGFARLWELHRLDLSVEALALDPQWRHLFTAEELKIAEVRLREHGWQRTS